MNCHDFLTLSLQISKIEHQQESISRNGIGRLYYFCYHEALELINSNDELKSIYRSLENMGAHQKVASVFSEYARQSKELKYGTVSRLLRGMHRLRCDADYDMNCHISGAELISMITTLKSLKETLLSLGSPYFQVNIDDYVPEKIQVKKKPSLRIVE